MTPQQWSWLLTLIGVAGLYLVSRGYWWAWLVNIGAQLLWIWYALTTDQPGFLFAAFAYGWVFVLNLRRALQRKT